MKLPTFEQRSVSWSLVDSPIRNQRPVNGIWLWEQTVTPLFSSIGVLSLLKWWKGKDGNKKGKFFPIFKNLPKYPIDNISDAVNRFWTRTCLLKAIRALLSDKELQKLRSPLVQRVGRSGSLGIIADITSLNVMLFACRRLAEILQSINCTVLTTSTRSRTRNLPWFEWGQKLRISPRSIWQSPLRPENRGMVEER